MNEHGPGIKQVNPVIHQSWLEKLNAIFQDENFLKLKEFLLQEKKSGKTIFPPGNKIFAAFNTTPFEKVKVVILGQDPYHGPGQANGLCFSVSRGILKPPSLLNIFKELQNDLGFPIPEHGDLNSWAEQGVLLLNAILTVESNKAASHQEKGWEHFTNEVIKVLSKEKEKLVFILWGRFAHGKEKLIDLNKHYVLKAAHPSPLSAHSGFFGCRHFSKANQLLRQAGLEPVDWQVK